MEADFARRDMLALFSGMAALAATGGTAQAQGTPAINTTAELSRSKVIKYDSLKALPLPNGGTQRRVMSGTLPTGEYIEIHESLLPAGKMPHPPHKHNNSEWLFIQTGTLEYLDVTGPHPGRARRHRVQRVLSAARPAQCRHHAGDVHCVFRQQAGRAAVNLRAGGCKMKFFYRMPMRLAGMILAVVVLVPIVLVASKLFPGMDRETIAIIVAFAMAASFAFPILGPFRSKGKSE
jgi:hypothetical protein